VGVSTKVLFTGNTFWGRYINDWSKASDLGVAYPFARLGELGWDQYDAWISGLECPVANDADPTSAQQEATLSFQCLPEYLPEAAKWFTAFTLANNHTDNHGPEGFEQTKANLDAAGIQHFGHYDPRVKDELCSVVTVPAHVALSDGATQDGELPLVMCGFHGVFMVPPADSINQIADYAAYLPVIAMPHMGKEYVARPDSIKTTAYRAMIDAGADMVIGDHPHWVQTTEAYQGKLIVYSMGNFMFDQQGDQEKRRSAAISVSMVQGAHTDPDNLAGWLEIAEQCRGDLPGCLALAQSKGLTRLDLTYEFAVFGTDDSEHQTHLATSSQTEAIKQRLNWDATIAALG
jgi:poly-gamma-glutamate synthesis protein (capsule biosynthesis protein)